LSRGHRRGPDPLLLLHRRTAGGQFLQVQRDPVDPNFLHLDRRILHDCAVDRHRVHDDADLPDTQQVRGVLKHDGVPPLETAHDDHVLVEPQAKSYPVDVEGELP
jgi:hypothetical protein